MLVLRQSQCSLAGYSIKYLHSYNGALHSFPIRES